MVGASDGDDDLSSSVSLLEIPDRLRDLAQRVRPVDNRRHLSGFEELLENNQVLFAFFRRERREAPGRLCANGFAPAGYLAIAVQMAEPSLDVLDGDSGSARVVPLEEGPFSERRKERVVACRFEVVGLSKGVWDWLISA